MKNKMLTWEQLKTQIEREKKEATQREEELRRHKEEEERIEQERIGGKERKKQQILATRKKLEFERWETSQKAYHTWEIRAKQLLAIIQELAGKLYLPSLDTESIPFYKDYEKVEGFFFTKRTQIRYIIGSVSFQEFAVRQENFNEYKERYAIMYKNKYLHLDDLCRYCFSDCFIENPEHVWKKLKEVFLPYAQKDYLENSCRYIKCVKQFFEHGGQLLETAGDISHSSYYYEDGQVEDDSTQLWGYNIDSIYNPLFARQSLEREIREIYVTECYVKADNTAPRQC